MKWRRASVNLSYQPSDYFKPNLLNYGARKNMLETIKQ